MAIASLLARSLVGVTRSYLRPTIQAQIQRPNLLPTPSLLQGFSARFFCRRDNCADEASPRCAPLSLAKSPCMKAKRKAESKPQKEESPFKSMWYNPECCRDPCLDMLPRFDDLYYRPSDKAKRKYQQTWIECPRMKIVRKKVCCFDQLEMPKFKKRCPKERPKTACVMATACKKGAASRCPTITMPYCRGARKPPSCKVVRQYSKCKKICCPYPSFSECIRPEIKPLRPTECECLRLTSLCMLKGRPKAPTISC